MARWGGFFVGGHTVSQAIRRPGQKSPLHRAVLERAAREVVGTKGRRRGIAVHKYGKNATYVAQVAEVSVE